MARVVYDGVVVARLPSGRLVRLTGSDALAFTVIYDYYRATGRRCFTYPRIIDWYREWAGRSGLVFKPQTFERRVRALRSSGVLYSFPGRLGVVFCLQPGLVVQDSVVVEG